MKPEICVLVLFFHASLSCWKRYGKPRVEDNPLVCLEDAESGPCFQGSWLTTIKGNRFASFQGIRYAEPPVGELRFKSPQPFTYQSGSVVDVSATSTVMCTQYAGGTEPAGQEDCLILNVYVPESALADNEQRAVMVWIHGGGLVVGSNAIDTGDKYSPFPLIDNDVIVVTINYRLSYLGFMFMGTEDVPGNAGLRDQSMALTWVRDNIAQFGGDPGQVTLFGQSAGSWSVSYHLTSPLSSGLFQRVIMQSGTSVSQSSSPVTPERALRAQQIVAEFLNCTQATTDEVLQCMQSRDALDLVNQANFVEADGGYSAPVVDAGQGWSDPFFPDTPENIFNSGDFNKDIEVMIGETIRDNPNFIHLLLLLVFRNY